MSSLDTDSRRIRRTSSGSVVLRQIDGEWHALLLRAWSHWDFPKGNVEAGESLMEAAVREVNEETGISRLAFPWGEAFARTAVYSRDKVAYYSIATTDCEQVTLAPNPQTGVKEHDEYRWVSWSQVRHLISPRLGCIIDWVDHVAKLNQASLSRSDKADKTDQANAPATSQVSALAQEKSPRRKPRRGQR